MSEEELVDFSIMRLYGMQVVLNTDYTLRSLGRGQFLRYGDILAPPTEILTSLVWGEMGVILKLSK